MSMCPKCNSKGFAEFQHGLFRVDCGLCGGSGEVGPTGEIDDNPKYLIIPEPLPGKTIDETADIARAIIKSSRKRDDSTNRDRSDNQPLGSGDTRQPQQPKKRTSKKKVRARTG